MRIAFLEADCPLTKTYTPQGKTPYPNAFKFKSHEYDIPNIHELYNKIVTHSSLNHALLKGELQRPLEWESRAGSTDPVGYTQWICLDIDGLRKLQSVSAFLAAANLGHVWHIIQYSSSYMVNGDTTLRAHVFIWLSQPVPAPALKLWKKWLNLQLFRSEIELTASHSALKWPLDISTGQNDKILYIANPIIDPPTLCSFTGQRIQLIPGTHETLDVQDIFKISQAQVEEEEKKLINELRKAKGLPARSQAKMRYKDANGINYLPNPDAATVTGVKEERGFVYLNINGGDSWGYYHPSTDEEFIFNFKGEPVYRTAEFVPDYFSSLNAAKQARITAAHAGKQFLAFQERRTAEYYVGWYDPTAPVNRLEVNTVRNEKQLNNFLATYGQPKMDDVPVWDIIYDPRLPTLDLANTTVNIFKPSQYMVYAEQFRGAGNLQHLKYNPTPTIDRLIANALGTTDSHIINHFINWLACIFIDYLLTQTAWVLHGIQGTGKGQLFNKLLKPLLGEHNVTIKEMNILEDQFFSSALEYKLLVVMDEVQVSGLRRKREVMAQLKNLITEPTINIRRMRIAPYDRENFCNLMFYSNEIDPVMIDKTDRRFNVAEYQSKNLGMTNDELDKDIKSEMEDFVKRLLAFPRSHDLARTVLNTAAKQAMQKASQSSTESITDMIIEGDIEELLALIPTGKLTNSHFVNNTLLEPMQTLLHDIILTKRTRLTREELSTVYRFGMGEQVPKSPTKFTQFMHHHKIHIKPMRINGATSRGYEIAKWNRNEAWFEEKAVELGLRKPLRLVETSNSNPEPRSQTPSVSDSVQVQQPGDSAS